MRYQQVCIESMGYTLPGDVWTSQDLESRLAPLYERLKLPEGRLELMTGIRERRFWPDGTRPSQLSVVSCRSALEAADLGADFVNDVGCLIHASVCRDFIEPATACTVHDQVGLRSDCVVYDVSNACLGLLNGMVQVANMIELGQIKAGLVVGSEVGRPLVESTIRELNSNESLNRKSVKPAFASLTIGSASCAVLLTHESISNSGTRLLGGSATANTAFNHLCQSEQPGSETAPLMNTDSEELMKRGIETGQINFERMLGAIDWNRDQVQRSVCHQVGMSHRRLMLESLQLNLENDFASFDRLGNTGAAALPTTLAMGVEDGFIKPNDNLVMLGIGSGINCIMLAAEWQHTKIKGSIVTTPENATESPATIKGPTNRPTSLHTESRD